MKVIENVNLKHYNSFGIDVSADHLIEWSDADELAAVLNELERPLLTIGQGSNLLFMNDFHGTVLKSAVEGTDVMYQTEDTVFVRVGSGMVWDDFVTFANGKGWWGIENLAAIPGQVGAAAVQNIGAYGAEAKDVIDVVQTISLEDGSMRDFTVQECDYSYRYSIFKGPLKGKYAVTHVIFKLGLKPAPKLGYGALSQEVEKLGGASLENICAAVRSIRESKLPDPNVLGNAGSFFMNPIISRSQFRTLLEKYPDMPSFPLSDESVKVPAGWLIEHAGWKGRTLGPAAVYERQALVLVNTGGACGQDIMNLANAVINSVKDKYGITLEMEANCI